MLISYKAIKWVLMLLISFICTVCRLIEDVSYDDFHIAPWNKWLFNFLGCLMLMSLKLKSGWFWTVWLLKIHVLLILLDLFLHVMRYEIFFLIINLYWRKLIAAKISGICVAMLSSCYVTWWSHCFMTMIKWLKLFVPLAVWTALEK